MFSIINGALAMIPSAKKKEFLEMSIVQNMIRIPQVFARRGKHYSDLQGILKERGR